MASYGVVKVLENGQGAAYPEMTWEPKVGFTALAENYRCCHKPVNSGCSPK